MEGAILSDAPGGTTSISGKAGLGGVINYRGVYRIGFRGLGCGGELIYCWLWVHCPNYMAE